MIVSHEHKFIFLKTNKTAGTSVELGLRPFCGPDDIIARVAKVDEEIGRSLGLPGPRNYRSSGFLWWPSRKYFNHQTAADVRKKVGRKVWDNYFKFTIERNPFDKAISRYWWDTRKEAVRPSLSSFLETCPAKRLSNWPIYTINDRVAVDHVIRFENLVEGLKEVGDRLGIGPIQIPRTKGSHRDDEQPYQEVLSPADRGIIERACYREIEALGYTWRP